MNDRPFARFKDDRMVTLIISIGRLPPKPRFSEDPNINIIEEFMWSICERCWKRDPVSRPSMDDLESEIFAKCRDILTAT